MIHTTWTVEINGSRYTPDSVKYFRTEKEADDFILNQKYILRQYNIDDYTITKDSHTWDTNKI